MTDASLFNSFISNATAGGAKDLYTRTAYNKLGADKEDAVALGTLTTDKTQLDVTAKLTRDNGSHYYKFTLDGTSIKANLTSGEDSSTFRTQLYNSNGKLIADSAGTDDQKIAYYSLTSSTGLKADSGDYTMRISYAPTAVKSVSPSYVLALYSGTRFQESYETTAISQTSLRQKVQVDDTLTFSTISAQQYSRDDLVHTTKATPADAINIGWIYKDKSALSVTSLINNVSDNQYYALTLQKGDNLKLAFNNKTGTAGLRVRLMDPSCTRIIADSKGTAAQQEAYENLTSADGLKSKPGSYIVNVTYDRLSEHNKTQEYSFQVYTGSHFANMYETIATTETMNTSLLSGSLTGFSAYNPKAASGALLDLIVGADPSTGVMDLLQKKFSS